MLQSFLLYDFHHWNFSDNFREQSYLQLRVLVEAENLGVRLLFEDAFRGKSKKIFRFGSLKIIQKSYQNIE